MSRKKYRKIYEQHYGPIPIDADGRSYEIHHIDGNHENNDPDNLTLVTIQEHYDIHFSNGDYGACYAISIRLKKTREELSKLSSDAQHKLILEGTHHFLNGDWQRNNQLSRVANGTHPFLGDNSPTRKKVAAGTYHMLQEDNPSKKRVENGTHNFLGPNSPSQFVWICEHCNKTGKGKGIYTRFHGDNCKLKGIR
jgi:hypothetical protein